MKKLLTVLLCICLLCAHSVTALAESQPNFEDFATAEEYEAAYLAWYAAEVERAAQENAVPESEDTAHEPVSDAPAPPMDAVSNDRYPLGSYVDPSGHVYSASGTLLSPPVAPSAEASVEAAPPVEASAEVDTLAVIAGLVEDIAQDQPVPDGLKALVSSLFGDYTPVTTTSVVTQTVGLDTYQYLVETVAPGAAGVDYEWLSGVLLFALLLFCFMKLLGGVLK